MKKAIKKIIIFLCLLCFALLSGAQNLKIDSLKQRLESLSEDTAKVNLLYALSNEYLWSFPDIGKTYAEKGLQLSKKLGYKYGEGVCSYNLSVGLSQTGDFTNALDFGFRAIKIFEDMKDSSQLVVGHVTLMICYRDQGDYKQALLQGYKAKGLQELLPFDSWTNQLVFANISSVYEKNDQLDSALYYAQKAYELDNGASSVLITLGGVYFKMGNPDKALNYYRMEIYANTLYKSEWALMDTYIGMSKAFEGARKMDSSVYYARISFSKAMNIDNPQGVMNASKQLAHLYDLKSIQDSTVKYLKLTITLNDSLFSRQKIKEVQSFTFNKEIHQQELEAQQAQEKNTVRMYALLVAVFVFLVIAFILWRNNMHKQKVNTVLEQKNGQIQNTLTELKYTQSQLIQKEKMASLGELTAGIAHEIQNPLNFVNNFSEVNKELIEEMNEEIDKGNYTDAKEIAKDIKDNEEKINHHGKRADAIVKGMLQHSQTSTGQKEPTNINKLADEYLRLAYHGLRAKDNSFNAALKTDFDESIGTINIIPQDIGRVLLNLYNNAFYAVAEKTKGQGESFDPIVSVSTKKMGDTILIGVKDNGNGIQQKVVDKIFQPFFTTKPTGQGTGLGLSLSYDIIKAHGGEIKVETKEGEGSEFIIYLPLKLSY